MPEPLAGSLHPHRYVYAEDRCACGEKVQLRYHAAHVRSAESDTSRNARPDTDQPVTNWPESTHEQGS